VYAFTRWHANLELQISVMAGYRHYSIISVQRSSVYANTLVKQARKKFEDCLAKKIKNDRKSFFAYVRRKSKCNVKVGSLLNSNGQLISDTTQKAEVLNDFWVSIY